MAEPVRCSLRPARHRDLTRPDQVTAPARPDGHTHPAQRTTKIGQAAEPVSGKGGHNHFHGHKHQTTSALAHAIGRWIEAKAAATARTPDPQTHKVIEELRRDGSLPGPGAEQEPRAGMREPAKPKAEPESEAGPRNEADVSERIDASIRRIQQSGERVAADAEAEQQERSGYAARIAREAQYEAETAHAWPSSQAEDRSAQMDYEAEL
jgi:hypothetical protein